MCTQINHNKFGLELRGKVWAMWSNNYFSTRLMLDVEVCNLCQARTTFNKLIPASGTRQLPFNNLANKVALWFHQECPSQGVTVTILEPLFTKKYKPSQSRNKTMYVIILNINLNKVCQPWTFSVLATAFQYSDCNGMGRKLTFLPYRCI